MLGTIELLGRQTAKAYDGFRARIDGLDEAEFSWQPDPGGRPSISPPRARGTGRVRWGLPTATASASRDCARATGCATPP